MTSKVKMGYAIILVFTFALTEDRKTAFHCDYAHVSGPLSL
jgi:hypothetical protein